MKFLIPLFSFLIILKTGHSQAVEVGAQQFNNYISELKDKQVGVIVNQTSVVDNVHLIDCLLEKGIQVKKIFSPEHGFRGDADAGEYVENGIDKETNLPVISLYGNNKKPTQAQIEDLDVLIFDIQDVGARFYTYISTMHYAMEACAENNKQFIVLDRPNPNGHYVDGPILDLKFQSFVGMHPIPIVHGLTVGELATMINGEKWLNNNLTCNLKIVKCKNYNHTTFYDLPIAPSPNLPNMKSIYLYPSLCLIEGTNVSCGRGTNKQFQIMGHPNYANSKLNTFSFTPKPNAGSKKPKHENKTCFGIDLSTKEIEQLQKEKFNISYLLMMYENFTPKTDFFIENNMFEKLVGNSDLRPQIKEQKSELEIRRSWEPKLAEYKTLRKKYLLYNDFE